MTTSLAGVPSPPPGAPVSIIAKLSRYSGGMTAEQVADCLGVTTDQVYRYFKKGDLPGFKLGRLIRFEPASLAAWCKHAGL